MVLGSVTVAIVLALVSYIKLCGVCRLKRRW